LTLFRLDAELLGFLEYIKPTPAEEAATKAVTQSIRDTVKELTPHQDTEVFGSQASGLVLATSDIDIRLYDPENKDLEQAPRHQSRKEMVAHMLKFSKRLNLDNKEYMMVRMRHARYPLISTVHKKSGLDVQIVAGNDTSNSQQIIKQYMSEYPYLYAHFAFIKSMLDIRGLTDVYRGGLGSYSLFMMIAAALKTKVVSQTEGKHPGQSLAGKRLNGVLQFYAELDTYKRALMLKPPYSVAKHNVDSDLSAEHEARLSEAPVRRKTDSEPDIVADHKQYLQGLHELALIDPMQPYLLCLQDPADPLNDLGRKGYGWKHIQATFKTVRGSINQQMANSNREGWKGSIIAKAVGPCFEAYKARRAITEAYGQEILEKERAKKEAEEKAAEEKAVETETADI
jgi:non-canonical poly(A) RNA polymerase PAPD5/7